MATERRHDPDLEWFDHVQARSAGLVVAPKVLKEFGLTPVPKTAIDTALVKELLTDDSTKPALGDPWQFFERVLKWETRYVAGAPGGPPIPDSLTIALPEHGAALSPTWAVREPGGSEQHWQLLVRIEKPGVDPDRRGELDGWEATPQQRFERLLRDTGVFAGVLLSEREERADENTMRHPELRLIYAPRGETSGYLTFPLRPLATLAGRPMLAGLELLLDAYCLFNDDPPRRLPALLKKSREAQAAVSTALAGQVLGALHELLRGLDAAEPALIRELARAHPDHLYEGLLAVLMRLVFILYAEDRDLLPSRADAGAIYETSYSVRGLYAKLVEDAALNPDTMDERRGGWGRLLALFRLVHGGHPSGFIRARRGKLFDPDEFLFLEGRGTKGDPPRVIPVSDGCVLRILEGLMTLKGEGGARERLSYRALDVEQIGSVYETVMGFSAGVAAGPVLAIKAGKHNRTPVYVELEKLLAAKGKERIKYLKDEAERSLSATQAKPVETASSVADLAAALDAIVDERASPRKQVASVGTPILQPTDERRRTGSHYTPRSLTAPIVKYALEPAFERLGPDATPEQVLDLKVCDPAMGSGAFLVEAARAIGERLVLAWEKHRDRKPVIPPDEDEQLHARRLVAQRCLYGVDKNPRAVDLARLSLWLATLAKDHEFTFLDHALKCGDSLVGLTTAQIAATHWDTSKPPTFVGKLVGDHLRDAEELRAKIRAEAEWATEAELRPLLKRADAKTAVARIIGDGVIAAFFSADKPKKRIEKLVEFQKEVMSHINSTRWSEHLPPFTASLRGGNHPITPFHWQIEFPEVFARENSGFDAIVGNPPYLGGTKISGAISLVYFRWLAGNILSDGDKADLIAYFIRRIFGLLRTEGTTGLVTTSSVAEGDTRKAALAWVRRNNGQIYRAFKKDEWPGEASVDISRVHIAKGIQISPSILEGREVSAINSFLGAGSFDYEPLRLIENAGICFEGFVPYGEGFIFDDNSDGASPRTLMSDVLSREPQSDEVIYPYLGGEEVTEHPMVVPARHVIYLARMSETEVRTRYPAIYELLRQEVRPYRMSKSERVAKAPWWQFLWPRPNLYRRMMASETMIVTSRVSKYHAFVRVSTRVIPSTRLSVITMPDYSSYAVIQSRVHEAWARYFGASRGITANYSPSECFEPFPFPCGFRSSFELHASGEAYHEYRAQVMMERNEGLTKTYNRFHARGENAPGIRRLRELHHEMDVAVLRAYGWRDLAERAVPEFIEQDADQGKTPKTRLDWPAEFKDEVLARLLALNAERAAAEKAAGLAVEAHQDEEDDAEDDAEE